MNWKVTDKSWIAKCSDYRGMGPADLYYRLHEISRAMTHCANGTIYHAQDHHPGDEWNAYTDIGNLVIEMVKPYRIVRR